MKQLARLFAQMCAFPEGLIKDTVPTQGTLTKQYPSHPDPSLLLCHQSCAREQRRAEVWVSCLTPGPADNLFKEKVHMHVPVHLVALI